MIRHDDPFDQQHLFTTGLTTTPQTPKGAPADALQSHHTAAPPTQVTGWKANQSGFLLLIGFVRRAVIGRWMIRLGLFRLRSIRCGLHRYGFRQVLEGHDGIPFVRQGIIPSPCLHGVAGRILLEADTKAIRRPCPRPAASRQMPRTPLARNPLSPYINFC